MSKDAVHETEIPRSGAVRSAKMVSIPLGLAGRGALGLGRQLVGQSGSVVLAEIQEKTAEQLFKVLGELKGGAMKFGQALSVFEAALPENIAKPYRETLTKLQEAAPPLPTRVVHSVLAKELGEDWRDNLPEQGESYAPCHVVLTTQHQPQRLSQALITMMVRPIESEHEYLWS